MVSTKFNLDFTSRAAAWGLALCIAVVFGVRVCAQPSPGVGSSKDQMYVETRMARFPITALEKLDLPWLGSPPQIPTNSLVRLDRSLFEHSVVSSNNIFLPKVSGVLRWPSFVKVMTAMDQKPGVEIYFMPQVSVTNGHPFWVKFVGLDDDGQIVSAVPSVTPFQIEKILQVTPMFSAVDQSKIEFKMVLPILDYVGENGFDSSGLSSQKDERGPNNDTVPNQSCFKLRETRVAVEVRERETLVLFGALSPINAADRSLKSVVEDNREVSNEFVQTSADGPIEAAIVFITPKRISARQK